MQNLLIWIYFAAILLVAIFKVLLPQKDSIGFKKTLSVTGLYILAFGLVLSLISLAWYKNGLHSSFHWFDDSGEWLQMDKTGHFFAAFFLSRLLVELYIWSGLPSAKAYLYGGFSGVVLHSSIELLDGYSDSYGASVSDLVVNLSGSLFVYIQYRLWGGLKCLSKISFHPTAFAALRQSMLGDTSIEQALKDYNGHTLWFNFSMKKMIHISPTWLHLSVGYGAEGLIGGHDNVFTNENGQTIDLSGISRSRQFYLSLDVNFEVVKTNSRFLRGVLYVINHFKTPMPTIEFNTVEGVKWHWVYF